MIQYVLMDIEGTTTRISFVKDVLFPYAYEKLENFLATTEEGKLAVAATGGSLPKSVAHFRQLIAQDVKDPLLKQLQGSIWKQGYDSGELVAHVYPDVLPSWQEWAKRGV